MKQVFVCLPFEIENTVRQSRMSVVCLAEHCKPRCSLLFDGDACLGSLEIM